VKTLADKPFAAGRRTVAWDGTTSAGTPAHAGVYFYRLNVAGQTLTRRMVVMR